MSFFVVCRQVERAAKERNAGVLFLGDFWHARGSLPVEPLNSVLEARYPGIKQYDPHIRPHNSAVLASIGSKTLNHSNSPR